MIVLYITGCEKHSDMVLSSSKMEDVLYDYHIAQGLIDQLPAESREENAQDYIDAVFAKHNITEAQFDSSIVYYNRQNKELYKIYERLEKRYSTENEELQLINGNNDMMTVFANGGDTTNIWNSSKVKILRNKDIVNRESFTIYADTSFRSNDQFIMSFSNIMFKEDEDRNDISLAVGLSVTYKNGKSTAQTRMLSYNGRQQMTIKSDEDSEISHITGFFYYQGKPTNRNLCIISGISLIRMHDKEEIKPVEEATKATEADTISVDSTSTTTERRYTPEELRMMNKSSEQIKIQTAPSVRTPNKFGTRKKSN